MSPHSRKTVRNPLFWVTIIAVIMFFLGRDLWLNLSSEQGGGFGRETAVWVLLVACGVAIGILLAQRRTKQLRRIVKCTNCGTRVSTRQFEENGCPTCGGDIFVNTEEYVK